MCVQILLPIFFLLNVNEIEYDPKFEEIKKGQKEEALLLMVMIDDTGACLSRAVRGCGKLPEKLLFFITKRPVFMQLAEVTSRSYNG